MGLEHEMPSAENQRAELPSRTVVVGYDGSDLARAALALARRRAGSRGKVVAVYVAALAPEAIMGLPAPAPPPPALADEEIGKRILADVSDHVTMTRQVIGQPASGLVRVAREEHAHEIVVGSHGAGRLRALLGSTSHALVHEADRPLVVLTERAREHAAGAGEPVNRIVLGYDGSEEARAALDYARRHLARGGEIIAVHACREPRIFDDIEMDVEVVAGKPAVTLAKVAASRGADEIVVGSRCRGALRAALGSVAHDLLHEADRPIVLVPGPQAST